VVLNQRIRIPLRKGNAGSLKLNPKEPIEIGFIPKYSQVGLRMMHLQLGDRLY
jgi:hypothetical protein